MSGAGFKSHPARHNVNPPPILVSLEEFEKWLCGYVRLVTAKGYVKMVRLLGKIGDVEKPEKVKAIICPSSVSEARKPLLANAYDYYCRFRGYTWIKPRFSREDVAIFLPLESELDMLVANTRLKMSVVLQLLKETGVDSGEAWKLRWIDIDSKENCCGDAYKEP